MHVAERLEHRVLGQRNAPLVNESLRSAHAVEARPQLGAIARREQHDPARTQIGTREREHRLAHIGRQRESRAHISRGQPMVGPDHAYELAVFR